MENKSKYAIIGIGAVILITLIIIIVSSGKNDTDLVSDSNNSGANNLINQPAVTGTETPTDNPGEPTGPDPDYVPVVHTKQIDLEIMTAEEQAALGIDPAEQVQVLSRDENGKVTAYKVIQTEEEALEYYGN